MQGARQEGIDKEKWKIVVGKWGIDLSDEQLESTFKLLDVNCNGIIT